MPATSARLVVNTYVNEGRVFEKIEDRKFRLKGKEDTVKQEHHDIQPCSLSKRRKRLLEEMEKCKI